ncbi:MAG TPA: site-specific DNA-methyltransferase [Candidatus Acidoferrales bacterium]|nr:site-specific DNA-methyltransferase [Candidatus Acidoferrales bacterium]
MTELIWDGKYKDGKKQGPVRIALPFQTIETVNESAQDRRRNLELYGTGRDTEWRNRLIWGDKKYVLPSLLPEFAGKVNLIYIDPPFDTGADFSFAAHIPDSGEIEDDEGTFFTKEPSIIEQKAYRDTWSAGLDSYLEWFFETTSLLHGLLAESGSLYVHLDWHVSFYAKSVLDEVFGSENFQSEIVWKRKDSNKAGTTLATVTDTILFYSKSENPVWNAQYVPYSADRLEKAYKLIDERNRHYALADLMAPGVRAGTKADYEWNGIRPRRGRHWAYTIEKMQQLEREGRIFWNRAGVPKLKIYLDEAKGVPLSNLWTDIAMVKGGTEAVAYPTQKPEALLERILKSSSDESGIVLDCFAGSGTTAVVAEKLNRRWIACDLSRFAIHTARKRLLEIPNVKPFVVQNLGKYERQAWQVAEFPSNGKDHLEEQHERESAYRKFILDLYHATPITGQSWLHGTKSGRMVHVAAVDAPVTPADVNAIARETWKAVASGKNALTTAGVDILGWEFALEVNELAKQVAAQARVDVSFKKIPREVLDKKAVEQGDVKFFELGALSVDLKQKKQSLTLKLADFVIPTDDIPIDARKAIKHWSQLVDYWAVDWDFKGDTFHNQWQAYRTRKDPKIELETKYEYKDPGKYRVVVKVIDILGNDTTKTLELKV